MNQVTAYSAPYQCITLMPGLVSVFADDDDVWNTVADAKRLIKMALLLHFFHVLNLQINSRINFAKRRNLLLPVGVSKNRQRAVYSVCIYRAEDLPQTDMGILASVQKAFTNKEVAFIDAFVQVSFVGLIVSKVVKIRS